ncbi:MAG TPA: alginate lyase family protein [Dongiaceae bacterium]|nr:alginate lyase family protein [Dongiaceae bacterium]
MDISWYLRRLRRMSPAEVVARLRAAAIQQAWRFGGTGGPAAGSIAWAGAPLGRDTALDPDAVGRLRAAADAVMAGRWDVFGRNFDTSAADPDWHRDVRSGIRFDPMRYCFDVPYRDASRVGNVKSLWEPSRLHHVTLLAAAFRAGGDPRHAERAAEHLRSWWRANPPLRGIHWLSGIELGMRLIAWVWTRRLLADWPGVEELFERNPDFRRQLQQHQRWLAALYSRGSSANNHLIAEAAGLFIAATAFRGPPSDRWARLAQRILEREAAAQTFADGMNRELAFGYHGYVLGLLILAGIEGEAGGRPMSDDYWRIVARMSDALAANLGDEMIPPRQGDGDDAWALLVDAREAGPAEAMLELGGALVGARDWWPKPKRRALLAALVPQVARGRVPPGPRPATRPDRFPAAGITYLRGGLLSCRVDHGPHGFLSTCAHGHADALSFELRIGGRPVLVDPGTYCYQGEPAWRRYFRSTVAHNTLEIEGADQAAQAGPFLWSTTVTSRVEAAQGVAAGSDAGPVAELTVAHDGYRRLRAKATHVRQFRLDRTANALSIVDRVEATMPVGVRLAFHVHPAVTVKLEAAGAELRAEGRLLASLELPEGLAWRSHRGAENPPLGWYSPAFGEKEPCVALVGSGVLAPGQRLETRISTGSTTTPRQAAVSKEVTV